MSNLSDPVNCHRRVGDLRFMIYDSNDKRVVPLFISAPFYRIQLINYVVAFTCKFFYNRAGESRTANITMEQNFKVGFKITLRNSFIESSRQKSVWQHNFYNFYRYFTSIWFAQLQCIQNNFHLQICILVNTDVRFKSDEEEK